MAEKGPESEGGEPTFQVRDRRQFTQEGERRPDAAPPVEARTEPIPPPRPAPEPPPPRAAEEPPRGPRPGAEDPPRKRSLRERILGRKEAEEGAPSRGALPPDEAADEINFPNFILSLMTQALMHLGEIPDPMTQQLHRDLGLAKQTIDLIALLQAKTKGNLSQDEAHLVDEVLYKLRMLFVEVSRQS